MTAADHATCRAYDSKGREIRRAFARYEADSRGNVYGITESGEVLPTGYLVPSFASRNDISVAEMDALNDE